ASDKWDAQRMKISRRNKHQMPNRRSCSLDKGAVFRENIIKPRVLIEWDATRKCDRGNARNSSKLLLNLLLDAGNASFIGYIGIGNCDAKRLNLARTDKSRVDMCQTCECPDHQSRTNQQDGGQSNLCRDKKIAGAMSLPVWAENAARSENAATDGRIFESRRHSEQ